MRKKIKIIFLDIDGVLNGYDLREHILYRLWKLVRNKKIKEFIRKKSFISDIDERRVKKLAKICKKTGAKIVISSSWRNNLLDKNGNRLMEFDDHKKFWKLMDKYRIEVIGKTPHSTAKSKREDEILSWLSHNQDKYDIENFIIFDDESSDLQCFVGSNLIKTSYDGYYGALRCKFGEFTGLENKHVKVAISKLNQKVEFTNDIE